MSQATLNNQKQLASLSFEFHERLDTVALTKDRELIRNRFASAYQLKDVKACRDLLGELDETIVAQ